MHVHEYLRWDQIEVYEMGSVSDAPYSPLLVDQIRKKVFFQLKKMEISAHFFGS